MPKHRRPRLSKVTRSSHQKTKRTSTSCQPSKTKWGHREVSVHLLYKRQSHSHPPLANSSMLPACLRFRRSRKGVLRRLPRPQCRRSLRKLKRHRRGSLRSVSVLLESSWIAQCLRCPNHNHNLVSDFNAALIKVTFRV